MNVSKAIKNPGMLRTTIKFHVSGRYKTKQIAIADQKMEIKTFVFFDTETTGLKHPNITELSMIAYRRRDLIEASNERPFPRVMTKILLHFNPEIGFEKKSCRNYWSKQ